MAPTDPANKGEQDVFGSLPSSRPQRRSAKRASTPGAAKPKAPAKRRAAAKPKAAAAKPRAQAKPKATAAKPKAKPRSTVPPAGYATPRRDEVPSGRGDLIGTAVQAAGEIAQIGVAAGTRALSSALKRLPRP
jgi:hypothetical protein